MISKIKAGNLILKDQSQIANKLTNISLALGQTLQAKFYK